MNYPNDLYEWRGELPGNQANIQKVFGQYIHFDSPTSYFGAEGGSLGYSMPASFIQPLAPRPLYTCGEAYSDAQGWVEGALQTANTMLNRIVPP